MIRKVAWLIPVILIGCAKETELLQEDDKNEEIIEEIMAPVQSDSCFLGDKIMDWENGEPVWRQDNFNSRDSIHRSEIASLYSNYMIQDFENDYVIIRNDVLYRHARRFTRIIQFDENGFQKSDYTYYDLKLVYADRAFGKIVLAMQDYDHWTAASPTYWTAQTLVLTDDLDTIKNARELGRYGAIEQVSMEIEDESVTFKFFLNQGSSMHTSTDKTYTVTVDKNFEFQSAKYIEDVDSSITNQLLLDARHRWTTDYHNIKEQRRRKESGAN